MGWMRGVLIGLCLATAGSAFGHECETTCSDYCRRLMADFQAIVHAHDDYCNGGNVVCVPNCTARYADGSCYQYGPDFCGRRPACIARCSARYSDASCRTWAADLCGEEPLNCAVQCTSRYVDGSCRTYGADHCGRNATCQAHCVARWPDGSCKEWGPDLCRP